MPGIDPQQLEKARILSVHRGRPAVEVSRRGALAGCRETRWVWVRGHERCHIAVFFAALGFRAWALGAPPRSDFCKNIGCVIFGSPATGSAQKAVTPGPLFTQVMHFLVNALQGAKEVNVLDVICGIQYECE